MDKEIIWVFGFTCSGKKTLIKDALINSKNKLILLSEFKKPKVSIFIKPLKHGQNQLHRSYPLIKFYEEIMTTQNNSELILIHGQGVDIQLKIKYLHELYPKTFNKAVWINCDYETLKERHIQRGEKFSDEIYAGYLKGRTYYDEIFEKYYKQIIEI